MLFYTPQEVAGLLRVKVTTVYDYIRAGRLRAARIGKSYRIAERDLEAFVAAATPPEERTDPARFLYPLPDDPAFERLRQVAEERAKYEQLEAEAWEALPPEAKERLRTWHR